MKIKDPEKRLDRFWGRVDRKHIRSIQDFVIGQRVLDIGCGYGTTTERLRRAGYDCVGIDYDIDALNAARNRYPKANLMRANAEELPFENGFFDVIVLRDALHHVYREADFSKVRSEILRVAKSNSRIIILDPNVNFILRTMRKVASHQDEECDIETAQRIMDELGFRTIHKGFHTVFSLPLSGGYVGIDLTPNLPWLHAFLLGAERLIEHPLNWFGLGRQLCWRYLLVGER